MKIVVFDLDETLGYFTEYGIFWDSLTHYLKNKEKAPLTQNDFDEILDLYPEFLRPNIINILTYLKEKKQSNCCDKMMIYTNNTGPREWCQHIIKYFEKKLNYKLIDQLIAAFKVNGKTMEICRTTHTKTHKDLIKCTKIPATTEICFLDDTFYPEMTNDNIYYINVKPYYHDLKMDYMIQKFKESAVGEKILDATDMDSDFEEKMMDHIKLYEYKYMNKDSNEYEIDKILSKQIISHLHYFFNKARNPKTQKNKPKRSVKRKTYRKYH